MSICRPNQSLAMTRFHTLACLVLSLMCFTGPRAASAQLKSKYSPPPPRPSAPVPAPRPAAPAPHPTSKPRTVAPAPHPAAPAPHPTSAPRTVVPRPPVGTHPEPHPGDHPAPHPGLVPRPGGPEHIEPAHFVADRNGALIGHGFNLPRGSIADRPGPGEFRLTPHGADLARAHLNEERLHLGGIDHNPLPHGEMIFHDNGHMVLHADGNRFYHLGPDGRIASFRVGEDRLRFGRDGVLHTYRDRHFALRRDFQGDVHIYGHLPDRAVLVNLGPHRGVYEHPVMFHGHSFVHATWVTPHGVDVRNYAEYPYHGVILRRYIPPYHYTPAFYGWVAHPWAAPAPYHWTFVSAPVYTAQEGYFAVAPVYPAPSDWLADQLLADARGIESALDSADAGPPEAGASDSASYQPDNEDWQSLAADGAGDAAADTLVASASPEAADESDDAGSASQVVASSADAPITPDLKTQLAEEIRQQIELDSIDQNNVEADPATALDGLPARLQTPGYIFVVYNDETATVVSYPTVDSNSICGLQPGDTLRLKSALSATDTTATLVVSSSHAKDCPLNTVVQVKLQALQQMWNSMRESMEAGLSQLRYDPNNGGLPQPPLSSVAAPLQANVPPDLSTPDPGVANMLATQQAQATNSVTQAEQSMNADRSSLSANP